MVCIEMLRHARRMWIKIREEGVNVKKKRRTSYNKEENHIVNKGKKGNGT